MMKKITFKMVSLILLIFFCAGILGYASESYPTKPIQVVVGWNAGGGTDRTAREIAPLIEKELGKPWVVTNVPGASGAIGAEQVFNKNADGYTLLFGSETIALWRLMNVSNHWYKDFETIGVCSQSVATIAVKSSSPWKTLKDFINYAKKYPRKLRMSGTGPGTTGSIAAAILKKNLGVEVTEITFQGQAPAVVAILGGHTDVIMENLSGVIDHYKSGKLRILAVFANERIKSVPEIPALGAVYPKVSNYLPYGAWFGLFAPKNTPKPILDKLESAMLKAVNDPKWQQSVWDNYYIPVGLTGNKAERFIDKWTSNTAWLIHEIGAAKKSPAELGIPKP
jgi:tripartite-type tricarboxylate transporter receptor subunit TctC